MNCTYYVLSGQQPDIRVTVSFEWVKKSIVIILGNDNNHIFHYRSVPSDARSIDVWWCG